MQELAPYELSPDVVQALIDMAMTSDVLLFGELHGIQEVPRLLIRLLDASGCYRLSRPGFRNSTE